MSAKELAKKLLEHPDFEVSYAAFSKRQEMFIFYTITGIDIGYSDKIINLIGDEK